MRRRGFTIIELLVVISIIALLISILLPSLAGARDRARYIKWKGYSHSMRTDTRVVAMYNFEEQDGEERNNSDVRVLWNRAAGDPNKLAAQAVEPEDMNGELGRTSTNSKVLTTGQDEPEWEFNNGRWRGKGALDFTPSGSFDECVRVKDNPLMDKLSDQMTVAFWASPASNLSGGSSNRLFEKGDDIFLTPHSSSGMRLLVRDSGGAVRNSDEGLSSWEAGQWYCVVGTFDIENQLRLYTNGRENGNGSLLPTDRIQQKNEQMWLGTDDSGKGWNGLIDEIIVMDSAMDATQVEQMYKAGRPRNKD